MKQGATMNDRQQRMYDFLNSQHIGVLSTVTPDSNPHGAVVYYAIDDVFCIEITTKVETRKYDNLKHNDHCMLTVFDPITQAVAQITAVAIERPDHQHVQKAINTIFERIRHTEHN
ncbi:pyridoxamine 5'-phosphate oxidase family protein, partial [Bacillus velezensis]